VINEPLRPPVDRLHLAVRRKNLLFLEAERGLTKNGGNLYILLQSVRVYSNRCADATKNICVSHRLVNSGTAGDQMLKPLSLGNNSTEL